MKTLTENELVKAAKAGDTRAFEELMLRNQGRIYSLGLKLLGNREDAADVLQETFIKVYSSLSKFEEKSAFATWIYRIATNFALMRLRRKDRKKISLDEFGENGGSFRGREIQDWSDNPQAHFKNEELKSVLQTAIDSLPANYRTVFILHDLQELPVARVGEILSLSVPAVKSRIHRSRLFLRERLSRYFETKGNPHEV